MKVVHLETGRHLYGGARQVSYLLDGLADTHVESVLVCRPGAEIADAVLPSTRVIEVPLRGDLDLSARRRLRQILREEHADALHVHSRGGADLIGGQAARAQGVWSVLTRRVDNVEPRLWARHKFRQYDVVAAISAPIVTWLTETVGLPPTRVRHIASAVDQAGFVSRERAREMLRQRFGVDLERPIIGLAGQLITRKGYDVFLAALPGLVREFPAIQALIFGRGPEAAALQRQAAAAGLADYVKLVGFEPGLQPVMAGFDLFVHPARSEGLGVALLEALVCGVPVIASRAGGIVDIVKDGATGVLVEPDNAAALASALIDALGQMDRMRRCGMAGQTAILAGNNVAAMTTAYLHLYESLAEQAQVVH